MKPVTALVVALVIASSVLSAQSRATFDLSSFGWGVIAHPVAVDTDGNAATQEWLVGPVFSPQRRVVAIQPDGSMCVSAWITIPGDAIPQLVHGRTAYTRVAWPTIEIISLPHPEC